MSVGWTSRRTVQGLSNVGCSRCCRGALGRWSSSQSTRNASQRLGISLFDDWLLGEKKRLARAQLSVKGFTPTTSMLTPCSMPVRVVESSISKTVQREISTAVDEADGWEKLQRVGKPTVPDGVGDGAGMALCQEHGAPARLVLPGGVEQPHLWGLRDVDDARLCGCGKSGVKSQAHAGRPSTGTGQGFSPSRSPGQIASTTHERLGLVSVMYMHSPTDVSQNLVWVGGGEGEEGGG